MSTETLASVVKDQPDFSAEVPAKFRRLLERCLEKNPKKRLRDIGDAEMLLESAHEVTSKAAISPWMSAKVAWGIAAVFLVLAASLAFLQLRQKPPAGPLRFDSNSLRREMV